VQSPLENPPLKVRPPWRTCACCSPNPASRWTLTPWSILSRILSPAARRSCSVATDTCRKCSTNGNSGIVRGPSSGRSLELQAERW